MMHKYPTSFQAVDCIPIHTETGELLLGRKKGKNKWRFIGGFVDPTDKSLEDTASREFMEEVGGIDCAWPKYLFSFRVDDERYRDSVDKIMSAVFLFEVFPFSEIKGKDDIEEVKFFNIEELRHQYSQIIVEEHIQAFKRYINNHYKK